MLVLNGWSEECLWLRQSLMHALLVIWTKSKHYNSSSRLVPLLQLITDHLIAQTRVFMPGKRRQNSYLLEILLGPRYSESCVM